MNDWIIKRNVRGKKISKRRETGNKKNYKTIERIEHVFRLWRKASKACTTWWTVLSENGPKYLYESCLQHAEV